MKHWKNLSLDSLPNEEWRPIKEFNSEYEVSSLGRVKSLRRFLNTRWYGNIILKSRSDANGYRVVTLMYNNIRNDRKVHRLVATEFIPNPENKPVTNHKDGIKDNNEWTNLEWNTLLENRRHAIRTGLQKVDGHNNSQSRLSRRQVKSILKLRGKSSLVNIGRKYGVSYSAISYLYKNNGYKNIKLNASGKWVDIRTNTIVK